MHSQVPHPLGAKPAPLQFMVTPCNLETCVPISMTLDELGVRAVKQLLLGGSLLRPRYDVIDRRPLTQTSYVPLLEEAHMRSHMVTPTAPSLVAIQSGPPMAKFCEVLMTDYGSRDPSSFVVVRTLSNPNGDG